MRFSFPMPKWIGRRVDDIERHRTPDFHEGAKRFPMLLMWQLKGKSTLTGSTDNSRFHIELTSTYAWAPIWYDIAIVGFRVASRNDVMHVTFGKLEIVLLQSKRQKMLGDPNVGLADDQHLNTRAGATNLVFP